MMESNLRLKLTIWFLSGLCLIILISHSTSLKRTPENQTTTYLEILEDQQNVDIMNKKRKIDVANYYKEDKRLVCYFTLTSTPDWQNLQPEDVDPFLCTHIIIIGADISNNSIVPFRPNDLKIYKRVIKLKQKNNKLKILLSLVGGFTEVVNNEKDVAIFAYNAYYFLITHGFDGLDLDWEFPAWPFPDKNPQEQILFVRLLLMLDVSLKLAATPPLLLTIAAGSVWGIIDRSYDVKNIAKYVDFVSLMGYDYHMYQSYMPFTGFNAPLFAHGSQEGYWSTLNIEWSANYLVYKGMSKNQIVVGIPTYGRTWKLLSPIWNGRGAPSVGVGLLNGIITYPQVLSFIMFNSTVVFDKESRVPYTFKDWDWISFENEQSITDKAVWIKCQNFSGVMTYNLNSDDWHGYATGRPFILHNIIKDVLNTKYNNQTTNHPTNIT